jgi:hypothetical protein
VPSWLKSSRIIGFIRLVARGPKEKASGLGLMRPAEEKEPERETERVNLVMRRVVIGNASRAHTHTGGDKPQSSTSFRRDVLFTQRVRH